MAIRLKHSSVYSTYFCTFTNFQWIHLFHITNGYDMVYEWFNQLKKNKIAEIIAFVPIDRDAKPPPCYIVF